MAYDEPLASIKDAERFGITGVTDKGLDRASARIRSYAGQHITTGISTVTTSGQAVRLAQRPLKEILTVTDKAGKAVQYRQQGDTITTRSTGGLVVTYRHGLNALPDRMREFVCTVARRMNSVEGSAGELGIQSEGGAGESVSFSGDTRFAATTLLLAEQQVIDSWFPRLPRTHWQGH